MRSAVHKKRRRRPAHARVRAAQPWKVGRLTVIALAVTLLATGIWLALEPASFQKAAYSAGQGASRPSTVAVVGDSITALSRQSIATSLAHSSYQPTIEAVVGIQMAQALPSIERLAQQNPNDWIIELGTNDAGRDNPFWASALLAEWQRVRASGCVIYVSVSPRAGPIAAKIDESLAGMARAHHNVHILDWGNLEYGNPAWVEPDMIHPTPAGQAELAALETQELRRDC